MSIIALMVAVKDRGFQRRVEYHATKAAIAIMTEVAGPRTAYAMDILAGRASIEKLSIAVLTQLSAPPTDAQIGATVAAVWNAMSGVTG